MLAFERPWALLLVLLIPAFALARRLPFARGLAFPFSLPRDPEAPRPPLGWTLLRLLRAACLAAGFAACALAAAGPALVSRRVLYLSRGNEVVFVLDVSPSMAASDIAPSRLEAAESIIGDFLASRRNETVGLVAFGGEAALVCPPTLDYLAFSERMAGLVPGIYGEGTAIGAGLATAVAHTARSGAPEKHIVLLTDGENNAGAIDPGTAALAAARFGIVLSVIGVGSPGEAPVSYVDPKTGQKRTGFYRSDFDAAGLEELARRGGGSYYAAENRAALAAAFVSLSERSASLARTRSQTSEEPLARPFLALALAAALLGRLLGLVLAGPTSPREGGRR
ncbi:MAG TPA: VWA domain-containing protein [Spirochaetales bacterium]|nr:VWA domain-containing protein [Spirochaetales bacterium]